MLPPPAPSSPRFFPCPPYRLLAPDLFPALTCFPLSLDSREPRRVLPPRGPTLLAGFRASRAFSCRALVDCCMFLGC